MNAIKCSKCGFLGFPNDGCCKRCGQSVKSQTFRHSSRDRQPNRSSRRRPRRTLVALAILLAGGGAIAGAVVVRAKLKKYFDKTPAYIEGISKSSQFKEPVTVRVNQNDIPIEKIDILYNRRYAGKAVKAADVLEALGLLRMWTETTFETKRLPTPAASIIGTKIESQTIDIKQERLIIALTNEGSKEAVDWRETNEPYQTGERPSQREIPMSWWRIPIGEREVVGIESARESADAQSVEISFRWRWRPNKLGEKFDCGGAAVQSLPQKARDGVDSLGWNSQTEYLAQATLKRLGNFWEVTRMSFTHEQLHPD